MRSILRTAATRLALWLHRKQPVPDTLYAERYAAYADACRRGDTRDQNARWRELREAMNARLKAAA